MSILPQTVAHGILAVLICLMSAGRAHAQSADKVAVISKAAVQIERTVMMPESADVLENYTRYYAISDQHETEILIGIFVSSHWDTERERTPIQGLSNAYFVESDQHLPIIMDGGCGIVTVYFDLEFDRLVGFTQSGMIESKLATCNGVA